MKYTIGTVELDATHYPGKDIYSDGIIEDEILEYVKQGADQEEILANDNRWPLLYHFSPNRRNLLEWYQFSPGSSLLEVGAGCGALTGLFCEKNRQVVAVELSKKRSEIIAYRHRRHQNLKIKIGNLNQLTFQDQFDYITLVGVLEYAGIYYQSANPYHDFLVRLHSLLKNSGHLILAIENKFGLKYWNGAAEDHSGLFFEGIQNYHNRSDLATFSKFELENLLRDSGYENITFYYPYPDYKLAGVIYSDHYLPKIGQLFGLSPNYDQERVVLFNEGIAFDNLIQNQIFDLFSNSYLVIAEKR